MKNRSVYNSNKSMYDYFDNCNLYHYIDELINGGNPIALAHDSCVKAQEKYYNLKEKIDSDKRNGREVLSSDEEYLTNCWNNMNKSFEYFQYVEKNPDNMEHLDKYNNVMQHIEDMIYFQAFVQCYKNRIVKPLVDIQQLYFDYNNGKITIDDVQKALVSPKKFKPINKSSDTEKQVDAMVEAMANGTIDVEGNSITNETSVVNNNTHNMGFGGMWLLGLVTGLLSCGMIILGVFLR